MIFNPQSCRIPYCMDTNSWLPKGFMPTPNLCRSLGSMLTWSTVSNLESVANLPCSRAKIAYHPQHTDNDWLLTQCRQQKTVKAPSDCSDGMSASSSVDPIIAINDWIHRATISNNLHKMLKPMCLNHQPVQFGTSQQLER